MELSPSPVTGPDGDMSAVVEEVKEVFCGATLVLAAGACVSGRTAEGYFDERRWTKSMLEAVCPEGSE